MKNLMAVSSKWPLIGNEIVLCRIEKDIASGGGRSHAYLLCGPRNIGKWKAARTMAQMIQCQHGFCQQCTDCKGIYRSSHADTTELEGLDEAIKIADIRHLINKVSFTPQGNNKVILIQHIERMTIEAANSFLKTLEEPPEDTIFIATTANRRNLLPTLVSRMRVYTFYNPSVANLKQSLKLEFPEAEQCQIENALKYSFNFSEKARNLLKSPELLHELQYEYSEISRLFEENNLSNAFRYIEEISKNEDKISFLIHTVMNILRMRLIRFAFKQNRQQIEHCMTNIEELEQIRNLLKNNINVKLLLEKLFLSFYNNFSPL